jgi:hypothetical protein
MPCECPCVYDSWFVFNLIVILLHLMVGCNDCQKNKIITNKFRNPFQQELNYMHNL